jgi:DNA integrity scanning protein DisA with diadenylate cyclase activity
MKALFVSIDDMKRYSSISGNLDATKITPYVEQAQDIHIQSFLGTDLYNKLQSIIIANTVEEPANLEYKILLEDYIKPSLVHWALVMYLPFGGVTIANGGIFKHSSENSEVLDKNEVDYLQEQERSTANYYSERLTRYICDNSTKFPEYSTNTGSDISPVGDVNFLSWLS